MPSKVYQYYPVKEERLSCIVCDYPYALDAPLSTLKKHLRVKHGFSIRNPPAPSCSTTLSTSSLSIPTPGLTSSLC
ncbi:hypothetical protein DSO57_1030397 [Entomophthora muscae]|uniref:Uncharacterized protein n=1 Tax=Entomophthora muscae TaxID=34485 RepID=A0ACC2RFJ3_9FUNG|nr:hypothetical protein DSO57_1030397 [Entomophthora muscae]